MVDKPITGGELREGVLGTPRFINPLLSVSDADRDLEMLVYSGLLRLKADNSYEPDLAKSYEISEDGLSYTFQLKDNLYWSDGEPVKADDIIFTILKAQDPAIKSVKRGSWNGVTATKINEQTVRFDLKKPYRNFLDNATLGILPAHLWEKIKPEQFALSKLNVSPIGSGPYLIKDINEDSAGIPTSYDLIPFKKFALGAPKIGLLSISFYGNEKDLITAYEAGKINSASAINPADAEKLEQNGQRIIKTSLPRVFAVFFNQSRNQLFLDEKVRQTLNQSVDRKKIVDEILSGYGQPLATIWPLSTEADSVYNLEKAKNTLLQAGWTTKEDGTLEKKKSTKTTNSKKGGKSTTTTIPEQTLSFNLATANVPELKAVATAIQADWQKLGAQVNLEFFEPGDLNQEIIRPRKYEALLFGQVIGHNWDLFPFWHSSQRLDPGLNIALYTNKKVDKLLDEIRSAYKTEPIDEKYQALAEEINNDLPAIFLYSPDFLYLVPSDLKGINLPKTTSNAGRFARIHEWYFRTDRIWKIFSYFY